MRDTIFFQGTKKHFFYERLMKLPAFIYCYKKVTKDVDMFR